MPVKRVFIEQPPSSSSSLPDLSLQISPPNTSSCSSSLIHSTTSNSGSPDRSSPSQQEVYTELSLSNPSINLQATLAQRNEDLLLQKSFEHQHHHHHIYNPRVLVYDSTKKFNPINGVPVYHSHTFPFLPNLTNKYPKICFYPASSTSTPPCFGASGDHVLFLNSGPRALYPSSHCVDEVCGGGQTRFNRLWSTYKHQNHSQYGTGLSTSRVATHGMMRSKFLQKLPAKRGARAPRMQWTSSLHLRFERTVELLGGHESIQNP